MTSHWSALLERVRGRQALVAVIGLGFVGIPESLAIQRAGYQVVGVDREPSRISALQTGDPIVPDVTAAELVDALGRGAFVPTVDLVAAREADVVVICVPTPLTALGEPDLSEVASATRTIGAFSARPRLVVLVSTVPTGTTRSIVAAGLADAGYRIGDDTFVGFAPERLDPGNSTHTLANTPRLVSGITANCAELTRAFYSSVVAETRAVSSPEAAELAKALENTFRFINISFANELAVVCDRLGLDSWEVVDAAASKPFAFLPHYPGPGVGGSCIPVVPHYLQAVARRLGVASRLVDAAVAVDQEMPRFVVAKLARLLAERGVPLPGARILVVGVAYKPNVADVRHSPAVAIIRLLRGAGVRVAYHDDLVPRLDLDGEPLESQALDCDWAAADAHVLVTLHNSVDRDHLAQSAKLIFDTRNALAGLGYPNVVRL
jgi:UDP-N-acetyl-D-glucosamine dehydrogenase